MIAEELSIDDPNAIASLQPVLHRIGKEHRFMSERMTTTAINDGDLTGMRTRYRIKLAALVKALNDLAHFQREIDARSMDAVAAAHADSVDRFLSDILEPKNTRFPADDEHA